MDIKFKSLFLGAVMLISFSSALQMDEKPIEIGISNK